MSQSKVPSPPIAAKKAHTVSYHGHELSDPYHWLRDPGYPEVKEPEILAHLEAENRYFESMMAHGKELTESIYQEIVGRIKQDDESVPNRRDDYLYRWKFEEGAQYRRWLRTDLEGKNEELLLDEVALAEGKDYFRLGGMSVSPDQSLLAYASDTDGSERFTLYVKDIKSGEHKNEEIAGTAGGAVWSADGKHLFYTVLSKEHRPYKVMRHVLGEDSSKDQLVYEENDPSFFIRVSKGSNDRYIQISCGDHVTSEVFVIDARAPEDAPRVLLPRRTKVEYSVDEGPAAFWLRINDTHKNFRLATLPFDASGAGALLTEVLPGTDEVHLRGHQCFSEFVAIQERVSGQDQVRIRSYAGKEHHIPFAEETFSAGLGSNNQYATKTLRVGYDSMVTPPSVFDYHLADDLGSGSLKLLKEQEIPSGYDKSQYATERFMATSHDGVQVPVSIVFKKGFPKDGSAPLHLYGYGAYGAAMSPSFSVARLSLLDRGVAYAIAGIRGGDEMGYHWYEGGKLDKRTNTFKDFIACAEHLVAKGYASKGGISISGGSAGGSLMGAVANMRPDLWKAVVAHVPFVDILNTMLDDSLPLTPIEWPEWGNPIVDKQAFEYILTYSPYENTAAQDYPRMMVTAGLNDPRVTYWEPAKWVAKLRELKTNDELLLFKTNMGAGHGGRSGRFERFFEVAEEFSFVLDAFGKSGS